MMNGKKPPVAVLDKARSRRDAAKMLAVALQSRYRKLLEATGEDEIVVATGDLAQCMYENIEFVIWALKHLGGLKPPPPEELRKITAAQHHYQQKIVTPEPLDLPCVCPPMEPGIIGYKHMASCPKFVPA